MAVPPTGVVTPEAVLLQLETAGVGSRLVAKVIDVALQAALAVGLIYASFAIGSVAGWVGLAGVFVALFVVLFVYPVAFESLWRGRTPGKAALGLRVVTVEGAPVRFRQAAVRGLLGLIDVYLLYGAIGLITIGLSSRNQRLGDMLAGTVVLRERTAATTLDPVTFGVPWGYEGYVATLDVSRVSATDYGAARSFLLRAASLTPAHRAELARQLAVALVGKVAQPPPAWVSPEAFLACLAAACQERARRTAGAAPPTQAAYTGWPSPPTSVVLPEPPAPSPPAPSRPPPDGGFQPPT